MIRGVLISGLLASFPISAGADVLSLQFPARADPLAQEATSNDSYFLATTAFTEGQIDGITAEGEVNKASWKVGNGTLTTLQLLSPLRQQLVDAGYQTLFECEAQDCGGFDFRYNIELLPEPDMHVNLADFRYLTAKRPAGEGGDKDEYIGLVVSRSANTGFVHLTQVGAASPSAAIVASTKAPPPRTVLSAAGPVGERLETAGHATLDDLFFKTGSSELDEQDFASLDSLAQYLAARPDRTVVLVGHTDSEGSLEGNVALSKRRAGAVAARLVAKHGVSRDQISANGVGFLAPRASNLTEEGRNLNRRVEVILTSTE